MLPFSVKSTSPLSVPAVLLPCLIAGYALPAAEALIQNSINDPPSTFSAEPIKLDKQKKPTTLLAQNTDTALGTAQSINLGEIRGKVFELLTNQPY